MRVLWQHCLSTLSEHEKGLEKDLLAVLEADLASLHEVDEPAPGGHEDVAALLQLPQLLARWGAAVHHAGPHPRAVGEPPGLLEDLGSELPGGARTRAGGYSFLLIPKPRSLEVSLWGFLKRSLK